MKDEVPYAIGRIAMPTPTVTVVFPVYNVPAETLRLSIESLFGQTYTDFEIIVVDDSSLEETKASLDRYVEQDRRVRILRPLSSRGLAAALNFGIAEARGKYIARADADDIQEPDRLLLQVAFLEANPSIGVVGSAIMKIDSSGQPSGHRTYPLSHERIRWVSCINSPVCHPAVTVRKDVLTRYGVYDPSFERAEDYELWLRLIGAGVRFANLEEPLVRLRLASSEKRERDHWRFNLRAKLRYFSFDHMIVRIFGITLVGAYFLAPAFLRRAFYHLYNRS